MGLGIVMYLTVKDVKRGARYSASDSNHRKAAALSYRQAGIGNPADGACGVLLSLTGVTYRPCYRIAQWTVYLQDPANVTFFGVHRCSRRIQPG